MRPNYTARRSGRGQHMRQRGQVSSRSHVVDSNGPSGRLRGTAPQLQEKYRSLAADAQAAGDRVLSESLWQYGEHYWRMVSEQDKRRDSGRALVQGSGREGGAGEGGLQDGSAEGIESRGNGQSGARVERSAERSGRRFERRARPGVRTGGSESSEDSEDGVIEGLGDDSEGDSRPPRRSPRGSSRGSSRSAPRSAPRSSAESPSRSSSRGSASRGGRGSDAELKRMLGSSARPSSRVSSGSSRKRVVREDSGDSEDSEEGED
ncbi:MAG: DUF4167 domain-containing protein [Alphaproteobacteria bacterium]